MAKFNKGDEVAQIVKPITGKVIGYNIDQHSGDILYQVEWVDAEAGDLHTRYFKESELEKVEPEARDENEGA